MFSQQKLLLGRLPQKERALIIQELQLLASSLLLKLAVNHLQDNRDLQRWLAMAGSTDPKNDLPYRFLCEKIPDFEQLFLEELRRGLPNTKLELG